MITITCTNNVRCELRRGAITGIVFNIQMWRAEKKGVIHTLGGIFKTLDYSLQIPDGKIPMFIEKFLKNKSIEPWSVESQMKPVPSIRLLVRSDKHSLTKTSRQHITWSQPRGTAKKIKAIKKLFFFFFFFWVVISVPLFQWMNIRRVMPSAARLYI